MMRFRDDFRIGLFGILMVWLFLGLTVAQAFTIKDFEQWWEKYKDTKPEFKPADLLTYEDREKIRPFLAPEAFELYIYPGVEIKIRETRDYSYHPVYLEATKKFGSQTKLGTEGELLNYVAGQPFPVERIEKETDPMKQGYMLIWNWEYRWQHQGLGVDSFGIPVNMVGPGGRLDRVIYAHYQRYYFTHRADLEKYNYTLPGEGKKDFLYKEWTHFDAPFDIKDTSFIVFRYLDFNKEDDAWAYIPALRRVRRMSMATRVDSLMGTDYTIDDFYNFSGRVASWTFKNLGKKTMLVTLTANRFPDNVFEGPDKWIPENKSHNWELRDLYFLETVPKWERHPYSKKILTIDAKTMISPFFSAYDRKGELWKYSNFIWRWSEDGVGFAPEDKGWRHFTGASLPVWDLQNRRATLIWIGGLSSATRFKEDTPEDMEKVYNFFDVNRLIRGR